MVAVTISMMSFLAGVELVKRVDGDENIDAAETDERGHYELRVAALGEWKLRISAPGFTTYEIPVFIPSDSWAI